MPEKENKEDKRLAKPGVVVELVKGDQWTDDLSGISLYRGFYRMASREDIKKDDSVREKGYVKLDQELNPTATLPKGKDLKRVEHALKLGTLKIYDPDNPTEYVERGNRGESRVKYDKEAGPGYRFRDEENENIANFLKQPIEKFKKEIVKIKTQSTLEKIYDAEYLGTNDEARARKEYIDAIKEHMKSGSVGGVGSIKSQSEETIKLK